MRSEACPDKTCAWLPVWISPSFVMFDTELLNRAGAGSRSQETNLLAGAGQRAEAGAFVILFVVRLCFQEFVLLTTFDTLISPSPLSALYLMSKLSPLAAHNVFCLSFS